MCANEASGRQPFGSRASIGLTYADAFDIMTGLGRRLAGVAITEYVPAADRDQVSAVVAARLAALASVV